MKLSLYAIKDPGGTVAYSTYCATPGTYYVLAPSPHSRRTPLSPGSIPTCAGNAVLTATRQAASLARSRAFSGRARLAASWGHLVSLDRVVRP